MKIFAKLDSDNKVIDLTEVSDTDAPTEAQGIVFLTQTLNYSNWKITPKNINALLGDVYDAVTNTYISHNTSTQPFKPRI